MYMVYYGNDMIIGECSFLLLHDFGTMIINLNCFAYTWRCYMIIVVQFGDI